MIKPAGRRGADFYFETANLFVYSLFLIRINAVFRAKMRSTLKESVDEWCYRGPLGENDEKAEKQQEQEDRSEPPFLTHAKEGP